ncbi:MAG: beta-galactosidase, partial [Deltaproteobacteria bacterium]|nr:beta-galactosidase [Deltaproteobacteria bacterium]
AAAHAAGLAVVLRPGPHANAELTYFGFPEHIVREPDIHARAAHGGPVWLPAPPRAFPVPSYASSRFHAAVRAWYAEVARVIGPHLAPDGPVVALGVDNEAQLFFRLGAYDHDYHPEAIAAWQADVAAGLLGDREAIGLEPEAPRAWDPAHAARCVAWVRGKSRYLARALAQFATAMDDVGLAGIARFHNLPPGEPALSDAPALEAAIGGPCGIDLYSPRRDLALVRQRALHAVGSSELPLVPEAGLGWVPWLPPIADPGDDARGKDVLLAALGAGIRGFSLYMAVARDRFYGAPIDEDGVVRGDAAWIPRLVAALDRVDWPALRRTAKVALVLGRADLRFGQASSVAEPMTPVLLEALGLGPGGLAELGRDDDAVLARRWYGAVASALDAAQVPYVIVDEGCPIERLRGFAAVIAPTLDRVDRGLWRRLKALADERAVVVFGPGAPTKDELGAPLAADLAPPRRAGRIRAGSLTDLDGLADDLAALGGDLPDDWAVVRPAGVTAAVFADASGQPRAIAITNLTDRAVHAELVVAPGMQLVDALTDDAFAGAASGNARISLPAFAARLLVVAHLG